MTYNSSDDRSYDRSDGSAKSCPKCRTADETNSFRRIVAWRDILWEKGSTLVTAKLYCGILRDAINAPAIKTL